MFVDVRHKPITRAQVLLLGTAICGLIALPLPALAQQASSSGSVDEIVVTGSRIPQIRTQSISPVSVVGQEDIAVSGVTRIEDLLNSLPQITGDQTTGTIGSYGTGTATVNLRNLGPQRTLVLINGRRLPNGGYYPGNNSTASAADINLIPQIMVNRVEVLTGGASAVYGADAVAGVVNFVLNDHFEGIRVTGNAWGYRHHQQGPEYQAVLRAANERQPEGNVFDGQSFDLNAMAGANFADDKGNFTAYAGYRKTTEVSASDRDFAACTLSPVTTAALYTCGGSSTNFPGRFRVGSTSYSVDANGSFVPYTGSFNFGRYNALQRPDKRILGGAAFRNELAPKATFYAELNFMEDETSQLLSPAGYIYGSGPGPTGGYLVNCDNPFLSVSQRTTICGANAGTANTVEVAIGRRNVEGGGQDFFQRHIEYRGVAGVKGSFGADDAWRYDASFSIARNEATQIYQNVFLTPKLSAAIQAVTDPLTGNVVCKGNQNGGNANPGCVPYNAWRVGAVTQAMTDYLASPFMFNSATAEQIVSTNLTGDLGRYGVKSPWADDGVGLALGAEYRRSTLEFLPDANLQQGFTSFRPGFMMRPISKKTLTVWEIFPEVRVPIANGRPGIQSLEAEFGYRYSDYSVGFNTNTWKAGLAWAPIKPVRFRGEINRAVRAPNLAELFGAQYVGFAGVSDPCSGAAPTATAAECARTGVTSAQYGRIEANAARQYNALQGGNPNLTPEKATTKTLGVVMAPEAFLGGLVATVDYFDTKIENVIGTLGADYILGQCTFSSQLCGLVRRDPVTGSLWQGIQGYTIDTLQNKGQLRQRGVDISLTDRVRTDKWGVFGLEFSGTYLLDLKNTNANGASYDSVGLYGLIVGQPNPEWRHRARVSWETPVNGLGAAITWRYLDGVSLDAASTQTTLRNTAQAAVLRDRKLPAISYIDLSASYRFNEKTSVRVGVNNVFDQDPPIVSLTNLSTTFGTGNTFPGLYDTMGRYLFAQFDVSF